VTSLLERVLAQAPAIRTLERGLASGRIHHALLFDGPDGVGKELAAFGLAQALVCEKRGNGTRACGTCSACTHAVPRGEKRLTAHPDVIVIERGAYDAAQIGRRTAESQDISIDQIRTLVLARAAFPPHEGRARIYVIRRAEELSTSAANALLKTLEEPTRGSYFILITSQAGALLSTIRSRAQRVRFGYLPDDVLVGIAALNGVDRARALALAPLAGGSASALLQLCDPEASEAREAFVVRALAALEAPHVGPSMDIAAEAKQSKDGLADRLQALATRLAQQGRALGDDALRSAARYQIVQNAVQNLDRNASAQLTIESMLLKMRQL
jgi:DNA polymerase III subunit delta'